MIWERFGQYFVEISGIGLIIQICGYAICRLAHQTNLKICDSGMISINCGFAICGFSKKGCLPTCGVQHRVYKKTSFFGEKQVKAAATAPQEQC